MPRTGSRVRNYPGEPCRPCRCSFRPSCTTGGEDRSRLREACAPTGRKSRTGPLETRRKNHGLADTIRQTIATSHGEIAVETTSGDGMDVVFIHGNSPCRRVFRKQIHSPLFEEGRGPFFSFMMIRRIPDQRFVTA